MTGTKPKRAVVIGSGFAGLSCACCLAQSGYDVTVLEKNDQFGGRARVWSEGGYTFDMGPSWYWMPDVFEDFFARFGKKPSDYYDLTRLDPSYRVYFGQNETVDVPARRDDLTALFERLEPGSGPRLAQYLDQAAYKYRVGMGDYVRRPSLSLWEFADARMFKESARLEMLQPLRPVVAKRFTDERLVRIIEFPVLFLGGTARNIPAMYSLMNHADLVLGTWYPQGGIRRVIDAMLSLAQELGVKLVANAEVKQITVERGRATGVVTTKGETHHADVVVSGADYRHAEQVLLAPEWRTYDAAYWDKRVLSPGSLLFYLGVSKRLKNLLHHNLFFDEPLDAHAREIYDEPAWPTKPLFYVCCPSQTDPACAPPDCENVFILIPTAPGLEATDTDETRERYYHLVMDRLEALTGQTIRDAVTVKRAYAHREFIADYHSFKGNAYGLANTLNQTAFFKPRVQCKKVPNLFFAGQMTVPGPGVPPSLISGEIVAKLITGAK